MKSPVCLSGPRPPRPRWRSQGRRRSTTQRSRPQRSEGRREAALLLREECGIRGPRATCRLGWSRRGRKLPDAVAAKAIEAQPSFGQIKPGEDAWDAAPRTGPETIWDTRHRSGLTHLCRATNRLNAKAAVGAFAATLPPAVCASATSPGTARQSFHVTGIPRPSAPAARLLFAPPWSRRASHHAAVSQPQKTIAPTSPPGAGRSLARVLCVRDRARRVETAKQVRAQPTSPGRRATPNSS